MKLALGQIQVHPGQPEQNLGSVLGAIQEAKRQSSDIIVLPEMVIPGYMLGDRWEKEAYIRDCIEMNQEVVNATDGITAIWGNVSIDERKRGEDGRLRKYNSAFIASNGKLVDNGVTNGVIHKALMPKYRMFDDERHFHSLQKLAQEEGRELEDYYKPFEVTINGVKRKISLLICEDIWNINNDYSIDPVQIVKKQNPDLIAVSSASPFGIGKGGIRDRVLKNISEGGFEVAYVNPTGIQNNGKNIFTFDGGSSVYKNGEKILRTNDLESKVVSNHVEENETLEDEDMEQILGTLVYGIREFLKSIHQEKVVIGLSGGLDSAISAALCTLAIGKENVIAVNMPSKFNSDTTKDLAAESAGNLGIEYKVFPIQESVDLKRRQIIDTSKKEVTSFNFENIQARERGQILADYAAHSGGVFTNNGNKTEVALGYATLYGDVAGSFCPIGDLYKSEVYKLARYINKKYGKEMIPQGIIDVVPSAELSDSQNVDEGKGDPFNYEYTDKLLFKLIEKRYEPEDILKKYIDGTLQSDLGLENDIEDYFDTPKAFIGNLEDTFKRLEINFFKRVQSPPIFTVSRKSFGFDLREAQNGVYFTRNYRKLKEQILDPYRGTRVYVPENKKSWETDFEGYNPQSYTAPSVFANNRYVNPQGWADTDYINQATLFESFYGELAKDTNDLPLNPTGRTGISGRGLLGNWGPNHACDALLIAHVKGEQYALMIERKDNGKIVMPGGMVDTMISGNTVKMEDRSKTVLRELAEETSVQLDKNIEKKIVYQGCPGDRRNTDNAWIETTVMRMDIDESVYNTLNVVGGDDAQRAFWVNTKEIDKVVTGRGHLRILKTIFLECTL